MSDLAPPAPRLRRGRGDTLGNALALFTTTILTSSLGFAFWWVVARTFEPTAVGAAGAALSIMQLIAIAAMVGLGTLLIAELSRRVRDPAELMTTAVIVTVLLGAILALIFGLGAAVLRTEALAAIRTPAGLALFVATAATTAALLVLDDAMIGISRASWQVWRNLVFSCAKLALIPLALLGWAADDPRAVIAAWLAGAILSFATLLALARRGAEPMLGRPRRALLSELRRMALAHHWLNLARAAPRLVMPLLVATQLSTVTNAYFFAALLLVTFAHVVPSHLATALFAIASGDRSTLTRELRGTLGIFAAVSIAAPVGCLVAGSALLGTFGAGYDMAATALTIMACGTFAIGVKSYYASIARINGDLERAVAVSCWGSALEIAAACLALALGGGIEALALAWVAAMTVQGVVLWPAIAVAGDLRGRPGARALRWVRWVAPRTMSLPADR